jgi:hypothetical protein
MTAARWRGVGVALSLSGGLQLVLWYLPTFYMSVGMSTSPTVVLRSISEPGYFEPSHVLSWSKIAVIALLIVLYVIGTHLAARRIAHVNARGLPIALLVVTACLIVVMLWPELGLGILDRTRDTLPPFHSWLIDFYRCLLCWFNSSHTWSLLSGSKVLS